MIINKRIIKKNSKKVFYIMKRMYHYSFNELQKSTLLENTELCLALIQLLQEDKIIQYRDESGIYYVLNLQ